MNETMRSECVTTGGTPNKNENRHSNDTTAKRISSIYKIINEINGKQYVGSSIDTKRRWHEHKKRLRNNSHNNIHLQRAWNKYGAAAFIFIVVEVVELPSMLCEREQYWINSTPDKYNLELFAYSSRGRVMSEETRRKLSVSRMGRFTGKDNPFYGRHHSPDTIENMKKKLSNMMAGDNNPFYGRHHNQETKRLISSTQIGRKQSGKFCQNQMGNSRGAKQYAVMHPNGKTSNIRNMKAFCRTYGLCASNAYTAISENKPYKGYRFQPL